MVVVPPTGLIHHAVLAFLCCFDPRYALLYISGCMVYIINKINNLGAIEISFRLICYEWLRANGEIGNRRCWKHCAVQSLKKPNVLFFLHEFTMTYSAD